MGVTETTNHPAQSANLLQAVRNHSLFSALPEETLPEVLTHCEFLEIPKGEIVFFKEEPSRGAFAILSGKVKCFLVSASGREQVLGFAGPGELAGENALFGARSYLFNAGTMARSSFLRLPPEILEKDCCQTPSFSRYLTDSLSETVHKLTILVEDLALRSVEGRLANYLISQVKPSQIPGAQGLTVELPFSKGLLASLLGTVPETLSRAFRLLQDEDLIHVSHRQVTLLSLEKLREIK